MDAWQTVELQGELLDGWLGGWLSGWLGWLHLGISERRRGQLPAAIAAYRSALERDPSLAAAQQNLAVALLLSGDVPGARSGFRQAIALLEQQNRQSEAEALRQQAGSMVKLDDQ